MMKPGKLMHRLILIKLDLLGKSKGQRQQSLLGESD